MATDHLNIHTQVQRRGICITLAELLVALLCFCFVSFSVGYWLSRNHSINFHAGAFDKLHLRYNRFAEDFTTLEVRVGLLEGKGQKKGWK